MPDAEPVLFHGAFTTDDDYPRRAAHAFMLFQLRRATVWLQLVIVLASILLVSFVFDAWILAIFIDVVIVVITPVSWIFRRRRLVRHFRYLESFGRDREISATESTFTIRTGRALSRLPFEMCASMDVFGDFVFIRMGGSAARVILARALFTDESLAFFRSKITSTVRR